MSIHRLRLTRPQILGHRRRVGALDARLPSGPASLRQAARAGLQDSVPRAALLSIHARVEGTEPTTWEDPSLVQVWGPRFSAYVVAAADAHVFTLGRSPWDPARQRRAVDLAEGLRTFLAGGRITYSAAGRAMGIKPNELRYATTTGAVRIHWDGARQPVIWTVPPPDIAPVEARRELARRFFHVLGPGSAASFGGWGGIRPPSAQATFRALADELIPVRTPVGDAWILADDETSFREPAGWTDAVRLLPSGDAYFLLQGADRDLLVPDVALRPLLWTSRVWPGAVLVAGEITGTWRRAGAEVTIEPWRRLSTAERETVEAEGVGLPIPDVRGRIRVRWLGLP